MCEMPIAKAHRHLLKRETRHITCACDACALRFFAVKDGHFALIPRDTIVLNDFQMSDAQWESLAIPINLAFFYFNSDSKKITALYPSPAGATECLLPLEHWEDLVTTNPVLKQLQGDVQALLVNRMDEKREYFLAPMDRCFELVGLIRLHWRGLSGGEEVWQKVAAFFAQLRNPGASHA